MTDEDEPSHTLKPLSPDPEPSHILKPLSPEPPVPAESQIEDNRDLETMVTEGDGNLMAGRSPVTAVGREQEVFVSDDELAVKDEVFDKVRDELPMVEDGDLSIGVGESEALAKKAGECGIPEDMVSIVDGELERVQESDGKGEVVKEDESTAAGEQLAKPGVKDSEEDVKVEEDTGAVEFGEESTGEAAGSMDAKSEEVTGEDAMIEPCQFPGMIEKDDELRCVNEAAAMKQDDESKGDHEALILDRGNFKDRQSQTVCEEKMDGEDSPQEKMDDDSLGLDGNTGSNIEDEPHQIDQTAAGSPLVIYHMETGEEALPSKEIDDCTLDGNIECREEETPGLVHAAAGSPLVVDADKDTHSEEETQGMDDSPAIALQTEMIGEDEVGETELGSKEMETEGETEAEASRSGSGGKRKMVRNAKVPAKTSKTVIGEDVCFICLDGGDLVLCDRRGCPKAYHPSCVDRDEAFFRSKGRWNCGWHLCSKCEKNAYYMCCTCAFSLCKGCIKDSIIFVLRGNKGLCDTCMKTVMLIESNGQGNDDVVTFDDKSQWEYLFKDYWMEQKEKLSFTSEEIMQAKNPWKGFDVDNKLEIPFGRFELINEAGDGLDSSFGNAEAIESKRKKGRKWAKPSGKDVDSDTDSLPENPDGSNMKRKVKRRLKPPSKEVSSDSGDSIGNLEKTVTRGRKSKKFAKSLAIDRGLVNQTAERGIRSQRDTEWASKELLDIVMHMRNGDKSVLSQFDVQELLLEYIKQNKLRDPRRRSQIVCDSMLEKLFGKPRIGHFEMLKLLESHFLIKEDSQADANQGGVVDTESHMDVDENTVPLKGRKSRKKGKRGMQSNLDDYAAIDMHNINLIYLRRNLMEALMEDSERFQEKVVGSFVRIRISGSVQKQDLYRLVQVAGTGKAEEPYKFGKRVTDIMLEILNLDKTELVSIDSISNQEFTEDECKRLRQSIKCGLNSRLTVGVVLAKAMELHEVRVTDWLDTEKVRLRHLCDRASDLGHKRELRENVEKLQLLNTPEERQRRLDEIPVVHADPNMDPSFDSDDESESENNKQEINMRQRDYGSFRRGRDQFSAQEGRYSSNDSSSPTAVPSNRKWDSSRTLSSGNGFSSRREDASHAGDISNRSLWQHGAERGIQQTPGSDSTQGKYADAGTRYNSSSLVISDPSCHLSTVVPPVDVEVNEAEKKWHYRDPTGKTQGPFSMVQLRKWNTSGFFPADLRIWRTTETEDDSILLTSALAGRYQKESSVVNAGSSVARIAGQSNFVAANAGRPHGSTSQQGSSNMVPPAQSQSVTGSSLSDLSSRGFIASSSVVTSNFSTNTRSLDSGSIHESPDLPSPTLSQGSVGLTRKRNSISRWTPAIIPSQLASPTTATSPSEGGNRMLASTHVVGSEDGQLAGSYKPPSEPNAGVIASSLMLTNSQLISSHSSALDDMRNVLATSHIPLQNTATSSASPFQVVANVGQAGSGYGYVGRQETVNPDQMPGNSQSTGSVGPHNNHTVMPAQQAAYGFWGNAPVNGQSQPYGPVGQFPNQNFTGLASQNQWKDQVPVNMAWGMAASGNPGAPPSSTASWGSSMPGNSNALWVGVAPGMGVGPMPGSAMSAANQGWIAQTGNQGSWGGGEQNRGGGGGTQQNRQSSYGSGGPSNARGQGICRFHESGHCKKGASCDYLHT